MAVACVSIPLQFVSGDLSARAVGRLQPAKLAAMEAHYDFSAHLVSIFREFTFPRQVTGSACNWAGSRVGCAGRTGNLFRLN
jgi:cytochrome bd-type quinol oxidase subunit 1